MNETDLENDENLLVEVPAPAQIDFGDDEVIVIVSSDEEDVNENDQVPVGNQQENTSDDEDNVEFDENVEESSSEDQEGDYVLGPDFDQFNVDDYPGDEEYLDDEIEDEGLLAKASDDDDQEGDANVDDTDRNGPDCIICMVMFEPCHHVVTCFKCSMGLTECCVCRCKVDKLVKVFLP